MAVLEGNPAETGIFTLRFIVPAGSEIPPHFHPQDERVTVLSGVVHIGFGDSINRAAMTRFGPGSFYVNPAGSHHYVWFEEESTIQITGLGPWKLVMIDD